MATAHDLRGEWTATTALPAFAERSVIRLSASLDFGTATADAGAIKDDTFKLLRIPAGVDVLSVCVTSTEAATGHGIGAESAHAAEAITFSVGWTDLTTGFIAAVDAMAVAGTRTPSTAVKHFGSAQDLLVTVVSCINTTEVPDVECHTLTGAFDFDIICVPA